MVGKSFGETGNNLTADVNSDGKVDIADLVLVGSHNLKCAVETPAFRRVECEAYRNQAWRGNSAIFFVKKGYFLLDNSGLLLHHYSIMKTRQRKKGEYHAITIRIPLDLWKKVKAKSDAESKSYATIIIENLRDSLKDAS